MIIVKIINNPFHNIVQSMQYNYLQNSIIPTYHFQKSLTKLPIPKIEDTITRYLNALKPILKEDEWKKAEQIARKFQSNEAIGKRKN